MNVLNNIKMSNLNEKESKEYLNKIFKHSDKEILCKDLYESFKKKESPIQSLAYSDYFNDSGIHWLYDIQSIDEAYYFSEYEYTLNITDSNNNTKTFAIYSTYEIYEIVKDYKLDNLFFEDVKYLKNYNYLLQGKILNFNYELSNFVGISSLTEKTPIIYNHSEQISPIDLSEYYSLYFENDDSLNRIQYFITEERKLLLNLIIFRLSIEKIFKFSGPSGIGKSFFLLYFSRTRYNCIYINLNTIRKLIKLKKYIKLKNVIAAECKRVSLKESQIISFNEMMINISEMKVSNIINELVKFFAKLKIIIILDQFKTDISIEENNLGNIRVIICSSINDKNIRQNCLENLDNILKGNPIDYNKYVYIPKLYQVKSENKIYSFFNNIPKFISRIKSCKTVDNYNTKINEIKEEITEKIKSFYKLNFAEYIMKIRQNLNVFIYIDNFTKIMELYPLKYFIFQFYSDNSENNIIIYNDKNIKDAKYFKVSFLFPYMEEILEELELGEQKKFFTQGLYKKHTGSTIGGFFELVTIQAIIENNLKLPDYENRQEIRVSRICDMSEIKPKLFQYIKSVISDNKIINDQKDNKMEVDTYDNIDYNKNNSIYDSLDEKIKEKLKYSFIFKESNIAKITEEYINNYNSIKIMVDEKLKYISNSSNLFTIEANAKKSIKEDKDANKKQDITINIINKNYEIKEKSILVTQAIENAPVYDLAYLYGGSQEKIFIGFQIKSYKDYEENKRTFSFNKKNLINKSRQLLLNSKYLLGVNITEWHFIIIGIYFNEKELNLFEDHRIYSESLVKYCQDNNLELILYNPIANKFYDSNKCELNDGFSLSNLSNVSGENNKVYKFPKPDNSLLGRKRNLNRLYESIETLEILSEEKNEKTNIIKEMENIYSYIEKVLDIEKLKFVNSDMYDKNDSFLPIPADNFLIMFKENKKVQSNGIKSYCFLIKKPGKDHRLYIPSMEKEITLNYAIQYFYYFDLTEKYYVFNFKEKKQNVEEKKNEDKKKLK